MADVVTTGEARDALHQIARRFDNGDGEPVYFGSHRRAQGVIVPVDVWERLLEQAGDELDLASARQRLAQDDGRRLTGGDLDEAFRGAAEAASREPVWLDQGSSRATPSSRTLTPPLMSRRWPLMDWRWSRPQWRSPTTSHMDVSSAKSWATDTSAATWPGLPESSSTSLVSVRNGFGLSTAQLDDVTLEIVAIGPRDEHAIYRAAAQRLKP
jgi:hypothetical protein